MRVYISGPIKADTKEKEKENVGRARSAMYEIMRRGHIPFCPHTMTENANIYAQDIQRDTFIKCDIEWLKLCDAILMLPGWEESEGANIEIEYAVMNGVKVFYNIDDIPLE